MNWTKKDKHLFTVVNQSGKYHLERQIQEASDKYFTLKTIPSYYVIFGYYNINNDTFYWKNNMNNISYNITKKYHMDVFGSNYTIKKLFRQEVSFDREYMNIIPYLMEALNEDLNVIRIKVDNCYIYALTKVDGIYKGFNYSIFEEALVYYRNEDKDTKKMNYIVKKERDVFECKENL
jgi:hypothetical protein